MTAYVCVIEMRIDLRQAQDLKQKRKLISSVKAQLRQRFGAAVSEIADHDDRRIGTLLVALVGGSDLAARADQVQRYVEGRCPDGCRFDRELLSLADLRD